jgi:hypothetical protein
MIYIPEKESRDEKAHVVEKLHSTFEWPFDGNEPCPAKPQIRRSWNPALCDDSRD